MDTQGQRLLPIQPLTIGVVVVGIVLLSAGCATIPAYQPNAAIVDTLGTAQARQRLQAILSRSIYPQVVETEVTDDFFRYRFKQAIAGFQTGAILETKVDFLNAVDVRLSSSNVATVRTSSGVALAQFVFGNDQDGPMFADLVASFRARRARSP